MVAVLGSDGSIRVVIVDDHTVLRQSLVKMVAAESGFEVVGEAGTAQEAIALAASLRPTLMMLDVRLPDGDGIELAERIRKELPATKVLFLTMQEDDATVRRALQLGVDGYVPKTASTEELLEALRQVASGGSYLSPSVTRRVMNIVSGRDTGGNLSEKEMDILRLLAAGKRPADVAKDLDLSLKTIKNHLTRIYSKLGVASAAQAVAEAYRLGIVAGTHRTD